MSRVLTIQRVPAATVVPTGECLAAVAEVDLTPIAGLSQCGFFIAGDTMQGVSGRLLAQAMVLQDPAGQRVGLCYVDIHSVSRYLLESVAQRCASQCGLSVDRLVLAATHTHYGPGRYHGNTLWDTLLPTRRGFDLGVAEWLAERMAAALINAADALEPALVHVVQPSVWGMTHNRSDVAFANNADHAQWTQPGWPGHGAEEHLPPEQIHVDPRVSVMAVCDAARSKWLGALASFACYPTCLGDDHDLYDSDWVWFARREVRARLNMPEFVMGFAGGSSGDVNAFTSHQVPGHHLAERVGVAVGDTIADALMAGLSLAQPFDVQVRYADVSKASTHDSAPTARLAEAWDLGVPTLAGSEEARGPLDGHFGVREGRVGDDFEEAHPQWPKVRAFGLIQELAQTLYRIEPAPAFPLHVVRIGSHAVCTFPGEPTGMVSARLEQTLRASAEIASVSVLGYAGDYEGYFTTEEEYVTQQYEGSTNIWGRFSSRYLSRQLVDLAFAPHSRWDPSATLEFRVDRESFTHFPSPVATRAAVSRPEATLVGDMLFVQWSYLENTVPFDFAGGPLLALGKDEGQGWSTSTGASLPLDDRYLRGEIRQLKMPSWVKVLNFEAWFEMPSGLDGEGLSLRIFERPGYGGDVVTIDVKSEG